MSGSTSARVLFVPLARQGAGTGHVRRCLRAAAALGDSAAIALPDAEAVTAWTADPLWTAAVRATARPEREGRWDLVVLDRFSTSVPELARVARLGPVVALDEGGEARRLACYLLDVIPGSAVARGKGAEPPNREAPELLELPPRAKAGVGAGIRKVLVSFGGEDPAGLTEGFVAAALAAGVEKGLEITVVEGSRFGRRVEAAGMRVVRGPATLTTLLAESDLVVTAYGLTAFESLATGTPVILAHPSAYHARLGRLAGLPFLPNGARDLRTLLSLIRDPRPLGAQLARFDALLAAAPPGERGSAGLASVLSRLAETAAREGAGIGSCPLCSRAGSPVLHPAVLRERDRTHFRCPVTGILFSAPFPERRQRYSESYFFEEYRAQYGKTYLEDFGAITAASRARVALLRGLVPASAAVLDLGCAYGPFLVACREAGYRAAGVDISAEAVAHVRRELGMDAWQGDFRTMDLERLRSLAPRCVTMWYVIEHFLDLALVLRRVNELLPVGGVLAFSTPSSTGVSGRSDLRRFLARSPADHYTIWSPRILERSLAPFGFRPVRVRVTGHHPERSRFLSIPPGMGGAVSRLFSLGDTFEAYAVKVGDPPAEEDNEAPSAAARGGG
jgi:2-polyprenyl-3-methyl-5-hydroxy-6-metoxy-1,4-benzoquinol methylase/spore coat polysaccharide biosynthesis predicted glycosyltransferase SpsG